MENEEDDDDLEGIDLDAWLQNLLAMTATEQDRLNLFQLLSEQTHLDVKDVEEIHKAVMAFLVKRTRGN